MARKIDHLYDGEGGGFQPEPLVDLRRLILPATEKPDNQSDTPPDDRIPLQKEAANFSSPARRGIRKVRGKKSGQ